MRPVFSVVMPTYGAEKYIEKAIRSVQAQTFENWELLVIDDCTCDQSAEIACEIAKTDSRIRIVHHEINQGLSAARNTGIQEAVGEYIWFMDPDDWVEPELMQAVAASLEKTCRNGSVWTAGRVLCSGRTPAVFPSDLSDRTVFYHSGNTAERVHPAGAADAVWICLEQIL